MKYSRWTILLGVWTALLAAGCGFFLTPPAVAEPAAAGQGQWQAVDPQPVVGEKMRMAAYFNRNFGIMGGAGDIGKARITADGGKTWSVADSSGG